MDEQPPLSLSNLIGLKLDEAREVLQRQPQLSALPLRVVETAPPAKPPHVEKPGQAKKRSRHDKPQTQRVMQWGEWRVLRCRLAANGIELLVAREELGRQEVVSEAAASEAAASEAAAKLFDPPV